MGCGWLAYVIIPICGFLVGKALEYNRIFSSHNVYVHCGRQVQNVFHTCTTTSTFAKCPRGDVNRRLQQRKWCNAVAAQKS